MQEFIATGKSVDEAVEEICLQLGLTRDDVTVEILEMPQKKLFGMSPAKVKVVPLDENFVPKAAAPEPDPAPAAPAPAKRPPAQPRHTDRADRPDRAARLERPAQTKSEPELDLEPEQELQEITEADLTVPAVAALAYLREMLKGIGAEKLTYQFFRTERGVKFALDGEDSSIVIGRRGETMDSLQYLCMLVSSRTEGDYCKIMLDVSGYRKKREITLIQLAEREAAKVKKSQYNQTLEPMNPYERRIVHSAIQRIEGVKSESVGSEPNRRVVISLTTGGKGPRRRGGNDRGERSGDRGDRSGSGGDRNRRNHGRGRSGSGSGGSRPSNNSGSRPPQNTAPAADKPKSDVDISMLYGKIDL